MGASIAKKPKTRTARAGWFLGFLAPARIHFRFGANLRIAFAMLSSIALLMPLAE
jgi:hypothetical protein